MLESDNELIQQKNCPICFGDSRLIDTTKTINPKSERMVELRECLICKHWWNNPLPTQELLQSFYENNSEYVVPEGYSKAMLSSVANHTNPLVEKLLKISPVKEKFNYLEIGIGSGNLFHSFQQKANVAYGVEPGKWVVGDKQNIVPSIDNIPGGIKFDIIVANDVLEHLNNPTEMLNKLSSIVNKDCLIHCTFPNKDCLKAKIQKGKWSMIRPFGHLHYFSARSIKFMFKETGWKIIKIQNCRAGNCNAIDIIKNFDYKSKNLLFRLVKSLILGQLLLGKDQWTVIGNKI